LDGRRTEKYCCLILYDFEKNYREALLAGFYARIGQAMRLIRAGTAARGIGGAEVRPGTPANDLSYGNLFGCFIEGLDLAIEAPNSALATSVKPCSTLVVGYFQNGHNSFKIP
jgi:hypothetical protein